MLLINRIIDKRSCTEVPFEVVFVEAVAKTNFIYCNCNILRRSFCNAKSWACCFVLPSQCPFRFWATTFQNYFKEELSSSSPYKKDFAKLKGIKLTISLQTDTCPDINIYSMCSVPILVFIISPARNNSQRICCVLGCFLKTYENSN